MCPPTPRDGCTHPIQTPINQTQPAGTTKVDETEEVRRMPTATKVKLKPLGDKVVVQPTAREETTKSGIVLPDTAKEKPQEGTIVAEGTGRVLDDGKRAKLEVS